MRFLILILILLPAGCGNVKERNAQLATNNELIMESVQIQATNIDKNRADMMSYFADAALAAAETGSQVDDALIAFAWGFASGQTTEVIIPKLQEPVKERDAVDYLHAFSPYMSLLMPFLYSSISTGTEEKKDIVAGRDVYIDSARSGSVGVDIFGVDSGIQYGDGSEETIPGYACGTCSWNSMLEGSCSCP